MRQERVEGGSEREGARPVGGEAHDDLIGKRSEHLAGDGGVAGAETGDGDGAVEVERAFVTGDGARPAEVQAQVSKRLIRLRVRALAFFCRVPRPP